MQWPCVPAFQLTSSGGRDFHTVTDAGNGLLLLEEVAGNAYQIFIVTQVFRRPASTEKDAKIVFGFHIQKKCDIRLQGIFHCG